jgi:hypothetical protein
VRVKYPPAYEADQHLVTFLPTWEDQLDALRLSSETGMIGPFLDKVKAGQRFGEPLMGLLPGERNTRDLTVRELVATAARLAAVADADYFGGKRTTYASPAPPVIRLDDYLAYVRQAAVAIGRSAAPEQDFMGILDIEPGVSAISAHPLLALPRQAVFPYRTLDVLRHSQHPEALWQDAERRARFRQGLSSGESAHDSYGDPWKEGFNEAGHYAKSETAFAWLASAAFGSDILDELAVMGLSNYAPNPAGWSTELADQTLRSTGAARWVGRFLLVLTDESGDDVPDPGEPAVIGVYVEDPEEGDYLLVGQAAFDTLEAALAGWQDIALASP